MLWGKIAVLGSVVFVVTLAAAFVAFFAGQMIIGDGGAALSDPGALRAVFGAAVYMTGGAVIGLALGALLRSSPAAIATLFGIMFLLEGISMLLLPQAWQDEVIKFLPSAAGSAVGAVTPRRLQPRTRARARGLRRLPGRLLPRRRLAPQPPRRLTPRRGRDFPQVAASRRTG